MSRSLGFGHCARFIGVLGHARTAPIHRTCPVAGLTDCNRVRINGGSTCRRRTVVAIPRLLFSVSVHENHVNHIARAVEEASSVRDSYEEEKTVLERKESGKCESYDTVDSAHLRKSIARQNLSAWTRIAGYRWYIRKSCMVSL